VACDLPFANLKLLAACKRQLQHSSADAVIPATEFGVEPLQAVYRRETCLPLVEAALKAGKRRVIAWYQDAEVLILPPHEVARYDPFGVTFWNVNTPEAFNQAEAKAQEMEKNG
jgi:molybdopterin-guanine dinucleotide biosynthesis protein A